MTVAVTGIADGIVAACRNEADHEVHVRIGDAVVAIRASPTVMAACRHFDAFALRGVAAGTTEPCAVVHVAEGPGVRAAMPALPPFAIDPAGRPNPADEIVAPLAGPAPAVYAATADRRRAAVWVPSWRDRGRSERARPLLPAIQAVLRDTGWSVLHSAAIGTRGRAVLLTGESYAGKTSLALAACAAGADYYGDDVVAVRCDRATGAAGAAGRDEDGGRPLVARIYDTAGLRLPPLPPLLPLVPEGEHTEELGEHRSELLLSGRLAGRPASAPIERIVHLARSGAGTPTFGTVSRGRVIATVSATTLQVSFGDLRHRDLITSLCGVRPPIRLDPGPDLGAAVRAALGLLDPAGGPARDDG